MALGAGDKLGPYEITGQLGKGGMGEVYRATDTRLHREVAIKVSAERFSDLFEREALGGKWPISNGGGRLPVWSQNGSELFYRTPDNRIMVAAYTAKGDSFAAGKPRLWSEKQFLGTGLLPNLDLAPDGKRFTVLAAAEEEGSQKAPTHVTFLLNFFDELRRRVRASGK